MILDHKSEARLRFLLRVAQKECRYLQETDRRLFVIPFSQDRAARLPEDPDLAERVEAFVSRFARLQDTLGDKLLPLVLNALGERTGAAIDNLDRAERLGLIDSCDEWFTMRNLRNQMVHEYVEDPILFTDALTQGHEFVKRLSGTLARIAAELAKRGWQ